MMEKVNLQRVLTNNRKWSMIIVGATAEDIVGDNMLVIEGLDEKSFEEQESFIRLIKDRYQGTKKLPKEVQIVIPVKNKDKLSPKIQNIALSWTYK